MSALDDVRKATQKIDLWNRRLEAAMLLAASEGASLRAIGEAAGLSHETVRYQLNQSKTILDLSGTKPSE